jgi:hypothetical protein
LNRAAACLHSLTQHRQPVDGAVDGESGPGEHQKQDDRREIGGQRP